MLCGFTRGSLISHRWLRFRTFSIVCVRAYVCLSQIDKLEADLRECRRELNSAVSNEEQTQEER